MNSFTATTKILDNLNKKYRYMDNILSLTKDMEQAISINDTFSFGKLVDMRGDIIISMDELDQENFEILSRLPEPLREKIASIILPKKNAASETLSLDNPLETNIYDTNKRILMLRNKVVKMDSEINNKLNLKKNSSKLGNLRG